MLEDGEEGEICLLHDLSLVLEIDHHWVDHLAMIDFEMITSEGMALDEKQVFEMILEVEMNSEEEMMISEETEIEMIIMMIEEFEMNQCLK